ncbi:MAG: ASCH domain-containing protein [Clostridia bacterium]|jgi:ASC-1-like (ASCH) protein|nr:ASCH domain-containing protein [Clostridia bacterium]
MAKHFMNLNSEPFDKIKNGSKKYELRLYDEKRQSVRVGDTIKFTKRDSDENCTVQVTDLRRFACFADVYAALPLAQCGYDISELNNASPNDMEAYYSKEEQRLHGVLAIKIKLL